MEAGASGYRLIVHTYTREHCFRKTHNVEQRNTTDGSQRNGSIPLPKAMQALALSEEQQLNRTFFFFFLCVCVCVFGYACGPLRSGSIVRALRVRAARRAWILAFAHAGKLEGVQLCVYPNLCFKEYPETCKLWNITCLLCEHFIIPMSRACALSSHLSFKFLCSCHSEI